MTDKHTSNGNGNGNDTNTNPSRKIHVVLLPFVAFGHMMPFHQLAVALADSGVRISFVSTPRNLHRLPTPPPSLAHLITPVALPFPSSRLPEGAEATVDVSMDQIPLIHAAFDALKEPFDKFVAESSPDFIIIDFIPHWAADVASDRGVPLLTFSAFSAVTTVFFGPPEYLTGEGQKQVRSSTESLTSPPPWVDFPSSVSFRHFEAVGTLAGYYGENPSGFSPAQRIAKTLQACQAMAIRSCTELEGEYLSLFAKLLGKPVIPVGLLPPLETPKTTIADETWTRTIKWLDEQRPRSVVFVGFGSECRLSKEQIHEIAHGLEASGLPFLWALRKPSWATDGLDALPEGFYRRNFQKWVVCIGWAPQMEILAHHAVGGTLFHAGWGSVIETLQFGHALVALPLIIEQPLNARLLVEMGLAIEVERRADGSFCGDGIAKALREAMVSEDGENMRARLRETAAMVGDQKLHKRYVDEFVEYLKNEAVKK